MSTDPRRHAHLYRARARLHGKRGAGLRTCSLGCEGQPDAHQGWDRRGPGGDGLGRAQWPSQSPEEPKAGPQTGGPDLGCPGPARAPPSTTSGPQASASCQSSLSQLAPGEGRTEAPLSPQCRALMQPPPVLSTSAHRGRLLPTQAAGLVIGPPAPSLVHCSFGRLLPLLGSQGRWP